MEFNKGFIPTIIENGILITIDEMFNKKYKNGYPSISITVYNESVDESDLPIFLTNNIYKPEI